MRESASSASKLHARTASAVLGLLLANAAAFGDALTITVSNDSTDGLLVSVYDLNANPVHRVLANERISGFASITVELSADGSGRANMSWFATTVGSDLRRCGHRKALKLDDRGVVRVHANSTCPK
jgi:hypothetical protein